MLIPISTAPALQHVDTEIFTLTFFGACMQCGFCKDSCCQYGCDVNKFERDKILALGPTLESKVPTPRDQWFLPEVFNDPEYPSGQFVRTRVVNGACVFLNQKDRGCRIHAWAIEQGRDFHDIKPMVCWLFPVCWDKGVLRPSSDVKDDLVCTGPGQTLYEASREGLERVFGTALVNELDAIRLKQ